MDVSAHLPELRLTPCASDSGGRNETKYGRGSGRHAVKVAGISELELCGGKGRMVGQTAVRWGYAMTRSPDRGLFQFFG